MKIDTRTSGVSVHYTKHKANDTAVNGLQRHNEREPGGKHSNKNIDDSRTYKNVFLNKSPKKYKKTVEDVIKNEKKDGMKNVRKNSVRMVEVSVQLSGKILEQSEELQEEVLRDMYEWLKEEHGEKNIVSAVIHKDETNMHLHFDFVPITEDKRLSARDILSKSNFKRYQQESLEYLQEMHPRMNFKRVGGETNGLSQKDFEILQKMKKENEDAMNEYDEYLNEREKQIDTREISVEAQEKLLNVKEQKNRKERESLIREKDKLKRGKEEFADKKQEYANSVKEFNHRIKLFKKLKISLGDEKMVFEREKEEFEQEKERIAIKDQEAEKKLLEATEMRNLADRVLEKSKGVKRHLGDTWQRILDMVRAGELEARKVEEVAEKYDPFTEEDIERFSEDILELSKGKSREMGL